MNTTNSPYNVNGSALVPVGSIITFCSSANIPDGYLIANGDTVPSGSGTVQGKTANFSELYTLLGSTFGSAGKMPDLRGYFVRGWDAGRGIDSGRAFGSNQDDENKSHNHLNTAAGDTVTVLNAYGLFLFNGSNPVPTSDSGGVESRPKNIALYYLIKY